MNQDGVKIKRRTSISKSPASIFSTSLKLIIMKKSLLLIPLIIVACKKNLL